MENYVALHYGEMAALFTALCWTVTSLAFESAGKKVGSLSVNWIRLVLAFFLLGILSFYRKGMFIPFDADASTWFWLSISGLIGFVLGDILLFQAFIEIGARISMLIMSLAPPLAALFGWLILGEELTLLHFAGMLVTIVGIAIVVLSRKGNGGKMSLHYPLKGILLALGGAVGQGLGLVISKLGMHDYDPFLSTQIRIIAGIAGFSAMVLLARHVRQLGRALVNIPAMSGIGIGAVFGPFLGVSFSLVAIQHTTTGVASTIMAIVPVLIIVPAVFIRKENITFREILGAIVAVAGVSILFI
ncbi:MAG: DMT family transporter [Breznakibacter sp.]